MDDCLDPAEDFPAPTKAFNTSSLLDAPLARDQLGLYIVAPWYPKAPLQWFGPPLRRLPAKIYDITSKEAKVTASICARYLAANYPGDQPSYSVGGDVYPLDKAIVGLILPAKQHPSTVYYALALLHRIRAEIPNPAAWAVSHHEWFYLAYALAHKSLEDYNFRDAAWVNLGWQTVFLTAKEYGRLERKVLEILEWKVVVKGGELEEVRTEVVKLYGGVKVGKDEPLRLAL